MLIDARSGLPEVLAGDIVIVGAGTVGLFLASLLAGQGRGKDILLIEAGDRIASTSGNPTSATSTGRPHLGTQLGRANGLGGTSSLWGGQLAEFEAADFRRPDAPWPISWEDVQPWYRRAYEALDLDDLPPDAECRVLLGGEQEASGGVERFFTRWLRVPNFAQHFRPLVASDDVRVCLNLPVTRIEFEGARARRLVARAADGREIRVSGRQFVFAGGTIGSARLFLTAQQLGDTPWKENRNVGRFFQDHLGGRIASVDILDERRFREYFENAVLNGGKLQPKLRLARDARRECESGACAFFGFDSALSQNVANLKALVRGLKGGLTFFTAATLARDARAVGRALLPIAARYARDRRIFAMMDRGVHLYVQAEQIPCDRSRIVASGSAPGDDGLLPVQVEWQCDGRETATIQRLAMETDAYLQSRGIARLQIDPRLQAADPAFLDTLGDTYHPCGGLRMAARPEEGVVDPDCRAWGTENVWVAGAAVFPSSSHANCTLTALALAARLVEKVGSK